MRQSIDIDTIPDEFLNVTIDEQTFHVHRTGDGEVFGLLWCHPCGDKHMDGDHECGDAKPHCEAMLIFGKEDHHIKEYDPLDIWPSLVCPNCHAHGNIIKGVWHKITDAFYWSAVVDRGQICAVGDCEQRAFLEGKPRGQWTWYPLCFWHACQFMPELSIFDIIVPKVLPRPHRRKRLKNKSVGNVNTQ